MSLPSDPEISLENYPIHTITGLVKRWLRELPDPLMTFSLYSDFLHAVGKFVFVYIQIRRSKLKNSDCTWSVSVFMLNGNCFEIETFVSSSTK